MHLILPGLYLGSMFDAKSQLKLDANQITHIVSVHDSARPFDAKRRFLCIQASDTPKEDLKDYFPLVVEFIHEARCKGGNVLVHCFAGVSRSVTLTAAYLIVVCDLDWCSALKVIRGARPTAQPNFGFKKQLHIFDTEDAPHQRKRLRSSFQSISGTDSTLDRLSIQKHLSTYEKSEPMASKLAFDEEHQMVKSFVNARKAKSKNDDDS